MTSGLAHTALCSFGLAEGCDQLVLAEALIPSPSWGLFSPFQEAVLWGASGRRGGGGDAHSETEEARGLHGQPHSQGRRVRPRLLPRVLLRCGGLGKYC